MKESLRDCLDFRIPTNWWKYLILESYNVRLLSRADVEDWNSFASQLGCGISMHAYIIYINTYKCIYIYTHRHTLYRYAYVALSISCRCRWVWNWISNFSGRGLFSKPILCVPILRGLGMQPVFFCQGSCLLLELMKHGRWMRAFRFWAEKIQELSCQTLDDIDSTGF